jgi:hypothetical protein
MRTYKLKDYMHTLTGGDDSSASHDDETHVRDELQGKLHVDDGLA